MTGPTLLLVDDHRLLRQGLRRAVEEAGFDVVEALRDQASTRGIPIMVLTAKTLSESDIRQLNGHVSTILRRGSTGAAGLLGLLREVIAPQGIK